MAFFASKTETVQLFFHVLPFVLSGRGCFFETYVDVGFLQRQNSLSKASKQKKKELWKTTRLWNLAAHHVIFSQLVYMCYASLHLYLYARFLSESLCSFNFQGIQLKRYIDKTLGEGDLREAVRLPIGEDLNEWLAVNSKF